MPAIDDYDVRNVRYPQPPNPEFTGRANTSVDYAKPTVRYPMAPATPLRVVDALKDADGLPIDFARSAGRYPMYGAGAAVGDPEPPRRRRRRASASSPQSPDPISQEEEG